MKTTLDTIASLLGFAGLLLLCSEAESGTAFCASKLTGFALIGAAVLTVRFTDKKARS